MKKIIVAVLSLAMALSLIGCGEAKKVNAFHGKVTEVQNLLDSVADDIYSNWYDAIYKDKFNEDINLAIAAAIADHESDLDQIEELDAEIADLFKAIKDGANGDKIKAVMVAYSDYYEFVVNVSGSFKTFSADKESLKKELASSLKDLSFEL